MGSKDETRLPLNVYTEKGFNSRAHYLRTLAADYGISLSTVKSLSDLLGPTEDFDGLVIALEDFSDN